MTMFCPDIEQRSLEEIRAYQEIRLPDVLDYLVRYSPFYRALFQRERIDLSLIPPSLYSTYASTEPCACGRNTLRISPIIGRLNQMLKIKGTTIYPPVVFDILDNMEEVHNYIVEINSSDFGTDVLKIFVDCTQIYDGIDKEIKDRFRAKLRIAPELCFLDKEELLKMQKAMEQRKPIKLVDNRIN